MRERSYGTHVYFNEGQGRRTYICMSTGKNILQKCGSHMRKHSNSLYWEKDSNVTDLSENKLQDSVDASARD